MLYTYCFLFSPEKTLSLPQGFKGDLQMIEKGAIAAVVEPNLPKAELEEDDQKLVQAVVHHDWVICELFRGLTVLPLRFGTYFRGEADLRSHLAAYEESYQQKLTALTGKVEVTLKLTPIPFSEEGSSSTAKGKAYLQAKKQRYQQQSNYQTQQQEALEKLQEEIKKTYPQLIHDEPKENTERFYLLIDSHSFSVFGEKMEQWKQFLSSWSIEISDPLPPYHFL
ncbi:Gas vesicle synthesis GvpLGvpF [Halothece sp. PCC 7418]|uniref:GvpL/GvpF family gas vesicle protein n=1 Tax=Halothece sp. (strain PCC 7418) TaxID=65093 RepID=UPI0002A05FCC|nr:GvpL/GvpF family gas vesicle protein [Halothece sp. PCC 7418]AFZ42721.1 Gas vesicle synthesis GvpLGvpF [Halothece sp. PCC 7418]